MAVAQVRKAQANASSTSVTATLGAAAAAGNLLVALYQCQGSPTITGPSGFTLQRLFAGNTVGRVAIWTKLAVGGETGITVSTSSSQQQDLLVIEYSGVSQSVPVEVITSGLQSSSVATSLTSESVSTSIQGAVLVLYGLIPNGTSWTNTPTNSFVRQGFRTDYFSVFERITSGAVSGLNTTEGWGDSTTARTLSIAIASPAEVITIPNPPLKEAVLKSHSLAVKVEVYRAWGGSLIYSSDDLAYDGAVLDGNVTVSEGDGVRRRLSGLRFVDPSGQLTPQVSRDIFTPFGNEVKVYRGVRYADGTTSYAPVFYGPMSDVNIDDAGAGVQITIQGYDRAWRFQRAKFRQDYTVAGGNFFWDSILFLLVNTFGQVPHNFASSSFLTPQMVFPVGDDPWARAQQMAAMIGCELFFDVNGVAVLQTIPDYSSAPAAFTYAEGQNGVMLYAAKRWASDDVFNYFIVTGESSQSDPVRGDAYDDNPDSPTYWRGDYGVVTAPVERSKMVTTAAQAQAAAQGKLQKNIGLAEQVHFNIVPNPLHDVGDVIDVVRAKAKINARYVLSSFSIPLTHNRAMDMQTRRRRITQ